MQGSSRSVEFSCKIAIDYAAIQLDGPGLFGWPRVVPSFQRLLWSGHQRALRILLGGGACCWREVSLTVGIGLLKASPALSRLAIGSLGSFRARYAVFKRSGLRVARMALV
jgi:hypothetical protein